MSSGTALEQAILDSELATLICLTAGSSPGTTWKPSRARNTPIRAISGWRLGPALLPRPVVLGESYLSESLIAAGSPLSGHGRIMMGRDRLNRKSTITP